MHALATWGPAALLVRRLSSHVAFVKADDAALAKAVERGDMPDAELLVQACSERGLCVACSAAASRQALTSLLSSGKQAESSRRRCRAVSDLSDAASATSD